MTNTMPIDKLSKKLFSKYNNRLIQDENNDILTLW